MKTNFTVISSLAIAVLLVSSAAAFASTGSDLATKSQQWSIFEQTTLPNSGLNFSPASHGTTFNFPDATSSSPAWVNYMLDTYNAPLTESNIVSATFTVTFSSTLTKLTGDTFGGFNLAQPTFVRLFFQSNLPNDGSANCGVGRANVNNFWWANPTGFYTFVNGNTATVTLTASFNNANWSGICGNTASSDTASFDLALANVQTVGLSFGSGYFFASGVGVDGTTGSATFQLTSFTVS